MLLPQPSGIVRPQVAELQRAGTQHVPLLRHTWSLGQVPQFKVPPHWLEALPQLRPSEAHVAG